MAEKRFHAIGIGALNVDVIYKAEQGILHSISSMLETRLEPDSEYFFEKEMFPELVGYLDSHTQKLGQHSGGSAANTIYALARMGFACSYVGRVGGDEYGRFLLEELNCVGVDTSKIIKGDGNSGICISLVHDKGRNLLLFPNENDNLETANIDMSYVSDSQFVHMSSFACMQDNCPLTAQIYVARNLPDDVKLSFDPGDLYARKVMINGIEYLLPIIENSYVIFMNRKEAEMLGKEHPYIVRGLFNYAKKAEFIVVKKGRYGSIAFSRDGKFYEGEALKTSENHIVDTTGAGDVYDAGFLVGLLYRKDLPACSDFANIVAGKSITAAGRGAYPTKEDLRYYFWLSDNSF